MKIDSIQPQINLQSFYDFAKLDKSQQCELLDSEAVFLDLDSDKSTFTKLYFLNGFFIEEIVCRKNNAIIDIIPFKQGYKIESYLEVKVYSPNQKSPIAA